MLRRVLSNLMVCGLHMVYANAYIASKIYMHGRRIKENRVHVSGFLFYYFFLILG